MFSNYIPIDQYFVLVNGRNREFRYTQGGNTKYNCTIKKKKHNCFNMVARIKFLRDMHLRIIINIVASVISTLTIKCVC